MKHLPPDQLARGVLTASAGNMAQGVAWNARSMGVPCTVIVPDTAPQTKLDAIMRLDGRIIKAPHDKWWQAFETRRFPGVNGTFVHAFDDTYMMAGSGTIGLEILEDLPEVDTIVVPWGGGGLSCGIAAAVRALKPKCHVFAAEVETAAPLAVSLAAGMPKSVEVHPSFVDGIGVDNVFPQMFKLAQRLLDGSLVTSLDDVISAVRLLAERNRVIAEGAGACSVASAITGKAGAGKIVCVVSGGNIDSSKLCAILRGERP
jgi:threonine dehydratase